MSFFSRLPPSFLFEDGRTDGGCGHPAYFSSTGGGVIFSIMLKRKIFDLLIDNALDDAQHKRQACGASSGSNSSNDKKSVTAAAAAATGETLQALEAALDTSARSNENSKWMDGVVTAEILANHIIENASIPEWHGNVDVNIAYNNVVK